MVIALPIAFIFTIGVSLLTKNSKEEEIAIEKMFKAEEGA